MGKVVSIGIKYNDKIDVSLLKRNNIKSAAGLISPAKEETYCELAPEHAAEPIKDFKR